MKRFIEEHWLILIFLGLSLLIQVVVAHDILKPDPPFPEGVAFCTHGTESAQVWVDAGWELTSSDENWSFCFKAKDES